MGISDARGLLVKLDDGLFDLLDHETEIRRQARPTEGALPRTDVVRELLLFSLQHFAKERGETVPEISLAPVTTPPKRKKATRPRSRPRPRAPEVVAAPETKPEPPAPPAASLGELAPAPAVVQVGRASSASAFGVRRS